MKRLSILGLFLVLTTFLSFAGNASTQSLQMVPAGKYEATATPKITFATNVNGRVSEALRLSRLAKWAEYIANTHEFREKVAASTFTYTKLSGPQVLQKLIDGEEELIPGKDNLWQISYVFEAQKRSCWGIGKWKKCELWVYGWTKPSWKKVYINSLPFPNRDDCGIVGTIFHEQTHKLGFSHPYEVTKTRPQSVPYSVGTIASQICKKINWDSL